MSDQRYKSDGLADESFHKAASNTSTHKAQENSENYLIKCQDSQLSANRNCSNVTRTPKKSDDSASLTTDQCATQRKNTLESSSHIVREVGHTVNQIISYEEEALSKIEKITQDIEKMYQEMDKIPEFEQTSEYKKYEEFFLQKNIELDNVDPKNNEQIRDFRKAAVKYVQDCMYNLDQKHNVGGEL